MNNWCGIGNITKDLILRSTTSGKYVCEFSIAINEGYGDNQRTTYVNIVVWGNQAENIVKYCSKGSKVGVSGNLRIDKYQVNNENKYKTYILANHVEFLDSKKNSSVQTFEVSDSIPDEEENVMSVSQEELVFSDDNLPFLVMIWNI